MITAVSQESVRPFVSGLGLWMFACLMLASSALSNAETIKPKIAIIIDDLGYRLKEGRRSIALEHAITVAIIPSSPHAKKLAEAANCKEDKEILVHMPMTPRGEIAWEAGLDLEMNKLEFSQTAERLLKTVPHAIGLNNHGGSKLTQNRERMDWLMTVLGHNQLFFVDSRTSAESVASEAAKSARLPYSVRDVFLDNERSEDAINHQIDRLVVLARKHGQAIAIGHPYNETLKVLETRLDELQSQGIELVGISKLLRQNNDIAATKLAQTPMIDF